MNKKRTVPVALQLYSVRGDMEQDFEGTLRAVGEMGYDGVELVGLYGRKPEAVREAVAAAGLVPVSAHVPYAEMAADPDGVMAAYAAAGCAYIAVPYLEEACRPGHDGFSDVIAALPKLGEAAGRAGLTLLYHNHDFEFTKVEGQYGLERGEKDRQAAAVQVGDRPKRRPGGTLEDRLAVPAAPQGPAPAEGPLRHPPLPRRQIGVVQQPLHRSRRAPALLGPAGQLLPGALHLGQRAPHLPGHSPRADRSLQLQCPGGVGPVSGQMGFIHGNMGGVRSRHGGSS